MYLGKEGVRHAVYWSSRKKAPIEEGPFFPFQKSILHPVGHRGSRIVSPDELLVICQPLACHPNQR